MSMRRLPSPVSGSVRTSLFKDSSSSFRSVTSRPVAMIPPLNLETVTSR